MNYTVKEVKVEQIIPLRHEILRPDHKVESAHFEGDDAPITHHFAIFDQEGVLIGCVSYMFNNWDNKPAYQLRGMAITTALQGQGVGSVLIKEAEKMLFEETGVKTLWCNARERAAKFYGNHGWAKVSEEFDIPGVGPHYKMVKIIG